MVRHGFVSGGKVDKEHEHLSPEDKEGERKQFSFFQRGMRGEKEQP